MLDDTDRQLAMRVLRDTLRDGQAKAADRVRAAQLMLEHDVARKADGTALAATDQELLAIARGEGGEPTAMGPAGTRAVSVPSEAPTEFPASRSAFSEGLSASSGGRSAKALVAGAKALLAGKDPTPDDLGRVPAAFLVRGPKKGLPISGTPTPKTRMGPKMGLPNLTPPPVSAQNGANATEHSLEPEPWE